MLHWQRLNDLIIQMLENSSTTDRTQSAGDLLEHNLALPGTAGHAQQPSNTNCNCFPRPTFAHVHRTMQYIQCITVCKSKGIGDYLKVYQHGNG